MYCMRLQHQSLNILNNKSDVDTFNNKKIEMYVHYYRYYNI